MVYKNKTRPGMLINLLRMRFSGFCCIQSAANQRLAVASYLQCRHKRGIYPLTELSARKVLQLFPKMSNQCAV